MPRQTLHISSQLELLLPAGSALARKAKMSRHEVLRHLEAAVIAARQGTSPFRDWVDGYLDTRGRSAPVRLDELFAHYFRFCEAVGVDEADRHSYSAFGKALTALGFKSMKSPAGHGLRVGCNLRKVPLPDSPCPNEAPVSRFVDDMCSTALASDAARARVRSSEVYRAYCRWAGAQDLQAVGVKRFARDLELLGFKRKKSNGVWWLGLRLLDCGTSPRPCGEMDTPSNAEGE